MMSLLSTDKENWVCACASACICVCTRARACASTRMCVHVYTCVHMCDPVCLFTCIYMCVLMHGEARSQQWMSSSVAYCCSVLFKDRWVSLNLKIRYLFIIWDLHTWFLSYSSHNYTPPTFPGSPYIPRKLHFLCDNSQSPTKASRMYLGMEPRTGEWSI